MKNMAFYFMDLIDGSQRHYLSTVLAFDFYAIGKRM